MADCPEIQKTVLRENGTFIAYIAYACKRRILAWIVCLSNCDCANNVLGETSGGAQAPETS